MRERREFEFGTGRFQAPPGRAMAHNPLVPASQLVYLVFLAQPDQESAQRCRHRDHAAASLGLRSWDRQSVFFQVDVLPADGRKGAVKLSSI